MKSLLTILGGSFIATSAFAQQTLDVVERPFLQVEKIGVHIASHHWPDRGENNSNPGMYLEFRLGEVSGLLIGDYRNSLRKNTFYVGKNWDLISWNNLSAGVVTSVATGYRMKITPVVAVTGAYAVTSDVNLRVSLIPRIKKYNETTVLHISAEYKF